MTFKRTTVGMLCKFSYCVFILSLTLFPQALIGQIEKVVVETYYVSDAIDATDTTGGVLEAGSKTYRIYVDLKPGSKIKSIYGDANHPLKFSSTAPFFNNKEDGQSFGKDFTKNRLTENTVALDTWLTIGQTTKIAAKTYFGVLKSEDDDGSFIGGINNDGGSAGISGGLLVNADVAAGIPLTISDGNDTLINVPDAGSWADDGFKDVSTNVDSTIFGSAKLGTQFTSYNAILACANGVSGVNPDSNRVLVAQLTTKGTISFELNIEVEEHNGGLPVTVKYVATKNGTLLANEKLFRQLQYPYVTLCGCPDNNYFEFLSDRDCDDASACNTPIVFGCTDTLACNYDPTANFLIPYLCCYPGNCSGLDITIVCPTVSIGESKVTDLLFDIYPNPAQDQLTLKLGTKTNNKMTYIIYDYCGKKILEETFEVSTNNLLKQIDVSELSNGLYLLRLIDDKSTITKKFNKN